MKNFTVFSKKTGKLQYHLATTPQNVRLNVKEGMDVIEGMLDLDGEYIDLKSRRIRQYPPKPGEWAAFDYEKQEWYDPRNGRQKVNDRKIARATASIPRHSLIMALLKLEKIEEIDALPLARGEIVGPFRNLDLADQVEFASRGVFARNDEIILRLQGVLAIPPSGMDKIFGIVL